MDSFLQNSYKDKDRREKEDITMKKMISIMATLLLFSSVTSTGAEEITASPRLSFAKKTAGFVMGTASGFFFHEAGHEIVSELEGVDLRWSGVFNNHWEASTNNDAKLRRIAMAGFGAQVISSEIILGVDQIPKDNAYVLGWLTYNVINAFYYSLANEFSGGHGDLETLRRTGIDTAYVEIGLIAHGLLTAYRVYRNPKFIPYIKATKGELILGIGWKF